MEKPLRKEIRLQWVHCNFPHYYTIFNLQLVREKLCALQQQFLLLDSSPSPTQCAACSCSPAKSAMYFPLLLCSVFDSLGSALHNKLRNWSVALLMELLAVPSPVYLPRTADSSSATLCSLFFLLLRMLHHRNYYNRVCQPSCPTTWCRLKCWESLPCADIDILRPPAASHRHATRPAHAAYMGSETQVRAHI